MNDQEDNRTEQNITNISDVYRDFRRGDLGTMITKGMFGKNYLEHW